MIAVRRLLLICASALAFLFIGCSDDNSTDPVAKITGDTTSAEFQAASDVFDEANDLGAEGFGATFDMIDEIMELGNPAPVGGIAASVSANDTLEYHFDSEYWYRVHSEYNAEEGVEWYVRDSLQFRHGNTAVMLPDSALLTELRFGRIAGGDRVESVDSIRVLQAGSIVGAPGEIAGMGDIVVRGTGSFYGSVSGPVEPQMECTFLFNLQASWNAVALNLYEVESLGGCPSSGSIAHVGSLNVSCVGPSDSAAFAGSWSASVTFNNGTETGVFENETTRWTRTRDCGPSQSAVIRLK